MLADCGFVPLCLERELDGRGQAARVVGLAHDAGVVGHNLRYSTNLAGDHWPAAGKGFKRHIGHSFHVTG